MKMMIAYIATVVLINVAFSYVPVIVTPIGFVSPVAILVGAVFVIRDFVQRDTGNGVLLAMLVATVLSYVLADPYVAIASAAAFAVSELIDYAIFTLTRRPFRERVIISSLAAAPIDTAIFLFGINAFTVGTFGLMVLSKLVAALMVR